MFISCHKENKKSRFKFKLIYTVLVDVLILATRATSTRQVFHIPPPTTKVYSMCDEVEIQCSFKHPGMAIWAKVSVSVTSSTRDTLFQHVISPFPSQPLVHYHGVYSFMVDSTQPPGGGTVNLRISGASQSVEGGYECIGLADDGVLIRKQVLLILQNPGNTKLCSSMSLIDKVAWVDNVGTPSVWTNQGANCGTKYKCNCGLVTSAAWYEDGLQNTNWGKSLENRPQQITIPNANITCACVDGTVTHRASNEIRTKLAFDTPMMGISPSTFATPGSDVMLTCADGCNNPTGSHIEYFKRDAGFTTTCIRGSPSVFSSGPSGYTLTITGFQAADNGLYGCRHKVPGSTWTAMGFPVSISIKVGLEPPITTTPTPPPNTTVFSPTIECKSPDDTTSSILPLVIGALLCNLVYGFTAWLLVCCFPLIKRKVDLEKPPSPISSLHSAPPTSLGASVKSSSGITEGSIASSHPQPEPLPTTRPSGPHEAKPSISFKSKQTSDDGLMLWLPDKAVIVKAGTHDKNLKRVDGVPKETTIIKVTKALELKRELNTPDKALIVKTGTHDKNLKRVDGVPKETTIIKVTKALELKRELNKN